MDADGLMRAQALVRAVPVGEKLVDAILALVRGARPETAARNRQEARGLGPRAARRAGADAGHAAPRAARWAAVAEHG
ncbi:MAG: hypothetical protein WDN04_07115 [Rhodospirillales bacterium]